MNTILNIIILIILNLLFFYLYLLLWDKKKSKVLFHTMIVFSFILYSIIIYYFIIYNHDENNENFFFTVSPQRKKCLEEQVLPIENRSCNCCGKGTVGGYPAKYIYEDLINEDKPVPKWNWNRVDNYDTIPNIDPPTDTCQSCSIGY